MEYCWNAQQMTEVFALPAAVVDRHIRLAGSAQLKVLMWLARSGRGRFDAAACAGAIGLPAPDCTDALQYWIETGVICPLTESAPAAEPPAVSEPVPVPAPQPEKERAEAPPAPDRPAPEKAGEPEKKRAVLSGEKPDLSAVLSHREGSPEFAGLLEMAEARFGRPLSHADMETLCYLHRTAALPAEVIMMVLAYAVSSGKPNMRYVEKVALDWQQRGIDTIAAAEEHLCRMERRNQAWEHVKALLKLTKAPTVAQTDAAEQWVCLWEMPDSLIALAYEQCREKTGKFQSGYMGKILESWHEDGIDTPEKALAGRRPGGAGRTRQETGESSLETSEFEKNIQSYIPVYRED